MVKRVTLMAIALLVVSCTNGDDSPPPTSRPSASVESSRPSVAPPVSEPVDLRPFRRHPCQLLRERQLAGVGFPTQVFEGADVESGLCEWRAHEDEPGRHRDLYSLTVHVTGDPLGEAHRDSNTRLDSGKREWPLFEERTISGLPTVVQAHSNSDRLCHVIVGTGNGQGITMTGSPGVPVPDLCERVVTAAELVVDAAQR